MSKAAKKEEQAVAVVQPTSVVAMTPAQAPRITSDLIIPRVLLMQGLSEFVTKREKAPDGSAVAMGDIVRSTNREVLGGPDKPFFIIPLAQPTPSWILGARVPGQKKFDFRGVKPRTAANDTLPWEFVADADGNPVPVGTPGSLEWSRTKCLTAFVLLPGDIDADLVEQAKAEKGELPDITKALTPVMVAFRSTSLNAGKELNTLFSQVASYKNVEAHQFMLPLGCKQDANDQGSYYVFTVDRSKTKQVKKEHLAAAAHWAAVVRSAAASLKVDETGGDEVTASASSGGGGSTQF